jgi:hypothetical protein
MKSIMMYVLCMMMPSFHQSIFINCSVHRYFTPAAMNEQNKGIKPNNDLSDIDKAFMTINYPPDDNTNKMEWTIELALDVIGIGDRKKNQIIETYRNGGWASLRQEFAVATPITKKKMSAEAQAIADGFRRMGVDNDPRITYGVIPSDQYIP